MQVFLIIAGVVALGLMVKDYLTPKAPPPVYTPPPVPVYVPPPNPYANPPPPPVPMPPSNAAPPPNIVQQVAGYVKPAAGIATGIATAGETLGLWGGEAAADAGVAAATAGTAAAEAGGATAAEAGAATAAAPAYGAAAPLAIIAFVGWNAYEMIFGEDYGTESTAPYAMNNGNAIDRTRYIATHYYFENFTAGWVYIPHEMLQGNGNKVVSPNGKVTTVTMDNGIILAKDPTTPEFWQLQNSPLPGMIQVIGYPNVDFRAGDMDANPANGHYEWDDNRGQWIAHYDPPPWAPAEGQTWDPGDSFYVNYPPVPLFPTNPSYVAPVIPSAPQTPIAAVPPPPPPAPPPPPNLAPPIGGGGSGRTRMLL